MFWLLSTEFQMLRDPIGPVKPITWLFAKVELSDFGSHIYSPSNWCLYLFSHKSHTHTHTHTQSSFLQFPQKWQI